MAYVPDSLEFRTQKIELVWNFIGEVNLPATIRLWSGKEKAMRQSNYFLMGEYFYRCLTSCFLR